MGSDSEYKNIRLLHNSKIDIEKWDTAINNADNSRCYALSWYLDIANENWYGMVYGDYEYVMPVSASSKFGIKYAYQPIYSQQYGIYPSPKHTGIVETFIKSMQKEFRFFEITFNTKNVLPEVVADSLVTTRKNFVLSLNRDIAKIRDGYSSHARRYASKSERDVVVSNDIQLTEFFKLVSECDKGKFTVDNQKLFKIISFAIANNRGVIYGAHTAEGKLCAAAFFLIEKDRFTYLAPVSNSEGKSFRAMFAIIDTFISNNAGKNLLIDFEGSIIDGIARFYSGFGALCEEYKFVHYNNLPWLVKYLKK